MHYILLQSIYYNKQNIIDGKYKQDSMILI